MEQLKCQICKTKRNLSEEEIKETTEIINKRNLKQDSILNIWNVYDGETCPEGGYHEYEWNSEFFQKMLDNASQIKNNKLDIIKNNNEIKDLRNKIETINEETNNKINQIKNEADIKIKDLENKINKNNETNIELEKSTPEIEQNILKLSGREWKKWL